MVLLAGCATVPMANKEADAAAKQFTVNPQKANIYVFREFMHGNSGWTVPVSIDDTPVGELAIQTYLVKEVDPGPHAIKGKGGKDGNLSIETVAGRNYFIRLYLGADIGSLTGAVKMEAIPDERAGRINVEQCCELVR
jgi:hypothetical protein